METRSFVLNLIDLDKNPANVLNHNGFSVVLEHRPGEPAHVNRLLVSNGIVRLELLPSKGLSVGEAFDGEKPVFWQPPLKILPDPKHLDLNAEMLVNGEKIHGLRWVEAFTGGVEMCGLQNWGMPVQDAETRRLLGLHGEASLIPVRQADVSISAERVKVSGLFETYTGAPSGIAPWYERGRLQYEVTKTITLETSGHTILLEDTITNRTTRNCTPDWGYHVQLRPASGARYLVPSRKQQDRAGNALLPDHDTWFEAQNPRRREERGILHQGLAYQEGILAGQPGAKTLLKYPDGCGILVIVPKAPFFLSWFSCGGKEDDSICLPIIGSSTAQSVFRENWDGVGPEYGASALDHDGNVDPAVPLPELPPMGSLTIPLIIEYVGSSQAAAIEKEIIERCA